MFQKKINILLIVLVLTVVLTVIVIVKFDYDTQSNKFAIKEGKNILTEEIIEIDNPIIIDKSNVELIGLPTTIKNNNKEGKPAIIIKGNVTNVRSKIIEIIDSTTFLIEDSTEFSVGDNIVIYNKIINDKLKKDLNKTSEQVYLNENFTILDIKNSNIYIDHPLSESMKGNNIKVVKVNLIGNIQLDNIRIIGTEDSGVGIEVSYTKNVHINNSVIEKNTNGIYMRYVYDYKIQNSIISNNLKRGLNILYTNKALIYNNNINNNGNDGIWLESSSLTNITQNIIDNNGHAGGGDGINLNKSLDNSIINNIISNGGCYGIWVINNSEKNRIMDNVISNGITYGIALFNESHNNLVFNNIVKDNAGGIHINMTNKNYIVKNDVSYNNYGIFLNQLLDNQLFNNTTLDNYRDSNLINYFIDNTIQNEFK